MNTPIPAAAYPVVEILRRDVPRPATLPRSFLPNGTSLRWCTESRLVGDCCPMGMHPSAVVKIPCCAEEFPLCDENAIEAYWEWFDNETDPQWVVDQTWGTLT